MLPISSSALSTAKSRTTHSQTSQMSPLHVARTRSSICDDRAGTSRTASHSSPVEYFKVRGRCTRALRCLALLFFFHVSCFISKQKINGCRVGIAPWPTSYFQVRTLFSFHPWHGLSTTLVLQHPFTSDGCAQRILPSRAVVLAVVLCAAHRVGGVLENLLTLFHRPSLPSGPASSQSTFQTDKSSN